MKDCISTYLGGEVVTPETCDYESYRLLGLKCPFCQSPVFLRSGAEFVNAHGKTVRKDAYFAHFKANSAEARLCEKRSASVEGRAQIEAIAAKQRNQRQVLYCQHFLDLILGVEGRYSKLRRMIPENTREVVGIIVKKNLADFRTVLLKTKVNREVIQNSNELCLLMDIPEDDRQILREVDIDRQLKICTEIFAFLSSRINFTILEGLILIAITFCPEGENEKTLKESIEKAFRGEPFSLFSAIIFNVLIISWARKIEVFERKKEGD